LLSLNISFIFTLCDLMKFLCTYCLLIAMAQAQFPRMLVEEFREEKGVLVQSQILETDSSDVTVTQDFALTNDRSDSVVGRIRLPRAEGKFPAVMLVVGVETGKDIVGMIEGHENIIVVGIDYPVAVSYEVGRWSALRTALALRKTGFEMIPRILLCLDWLFTHPLVDTSDVTLIAVSFGVFTGVPAAVADARVKRLVVVQAGGDLYTVVAASSKSLRVPLPSWLAGCVGSWILAPFEPNRYIGAFAPRPLLIVSGESDVFFTRSSVESLYEHAGEPKEWVEHKVGHVMPGERELIKELTRVVADRLYQR